MDQIVRVEGDAEEGDERVVPPGEEEQGDHVDNGEYAAAVPEQRECLLRSPCEGDVDDAEDHVGDQVGGQEDELQPRR